MTSNLKANLTFTGTTRDEYNVQGKSNNFIIAHDQGKYTAGEAARVLSKRFGRKITARQIEPLAFEFHHAGRFGRNMAARVFFFDQEELDAITIEQIDALAEPLYGWVTGFTKCCGRWCPVVEEAGRVERARAKRLGSKFHELSKEEAEEAKAAVGKALPAYSDDWKEAA